MSNADRAKSNNEVFDVERIRQLVEMMKEHDLNEVSLKHGDRRIRLRRKDEPAPVVVSAPAPGVMPAVAAAPVPAAAPAAPAPAAEAVDGDNISVVTSPMVGTFYSKPNPNAETYVKVGDHVEADTIVCVVEAMKMFNEIPAGISGKVVAVLVKNEEAVDVNKPLFKVDTNG
ncbi:MAG: acetyl-CoA carboxylase biotin carboxyl carrier protein [Planctomycetota bacterium]|jgi:acetyl-CoA carboxylase biotin carboxyl carrier protein|nr:acetyl-CoA carboxylase biotin carboxyl carrier protein [Planctomycetota bacterium]MEC7447412.1 acetyl-CoA carboxylase biotin carboxyl carrier protein [Planctomycetota bacterium]MEC7497323.1 acetyl-CoA carboxylase biotin carboxyl carrier protein [Planctomycetota bacterium]MEC7717925.1 acetyl-CoA carboxylase biotin carboxyl carrier protein [Planctomycetota bacterium]MEC8303595.1 acetyl-CoA carboxylase biotin carboxyl carrier protein [Planctomycetota bacterium]